MVIPNAVHLHTGIHGVDVVPVLTSQNATKRDPLDGPDRADKEGVGGSSPSTPTFHGSGDRVAQGISDVIPGRCHWGSVVWAMADQPILSAEELEKLTPDERARLVDERSTTDLSDLDPDFRARVEEKGRLLVEERGLLDPEHR
ncbi:MAG: hypothetical protein U5R31_13395 [Acidimicrobiia bacterium]|nr:hypothetical protein [Acidimicrobiia bacterium]